MFNNSWHKKEKPLLGLVGLGGGVGSNLVAGAAGPFKATGGFYSDYGDGGDNWRAHIFTADGTFSCSSIGGDGTALHYLIVGGGGGGSFGAAGGGGAGCVQCGTIPYGDLSTGDWAVTVGNGACGGRNISGPGVNWQQHNGTPSSVDFPSGAVTAPGGGSSGLQGYGYGGTAGKTGGSGGGGGFNSGSGGGSDGNSSHPQAADAASPPVGWGCPGGTGNNSAGGGGGGATGPGNSASTQTGGAGGSGALTNMFGGPSMPIRLAGGAGGGGGGNNGAAGPGGGGAGGGNGPTTFPEPQTGMDATMWGSGGSGVNAEAGEGGYGSNGVVILRYVVSDARTNTATGGWISNIPSADAPTGTDQTVHVFSGDGPFQFVCPTTLTCNTLIVGGGGGGSVSNHGGGGGAGGIFYKEGITFPNATYTITIGKGGQGDPANSWRGTKSQISGPWGSYVAGGGGQGTNSGSPDGGSGGGNNPGSGGNPAAGPNSEPHPGGIDVQSSVTPTGNNVFAYPGGNAPGAYSGGGGGASEAGQAPPGSEAGRGGNGARYGISGEVQYYAGGGGGGGHTGSPSPQAAGGLGGGGKGGLFMNAASYVSPTGEMGDVGRNGGNGYGGGAGGCGKFGVLGTNDDGTVASGGPPTAPTLIPAIEGGRSGATSRTAKGGQGVVIISYPT